MNYKQKSLRSQFLDRLQEEYGQEKFVTTGEIWDGKYREFRYKNLDEAYKNKAFGTKIHRDDFYDGLRSYEGIHLKGNDEMVSVWYKGRYVTWFKRLYVIPQFTIYKHEPSHQDHDKLLAHGWEAVVDRVDAFIMKYETEKIKLLEKIN